MRRLWCIPIALLLLSCGSAEKEEVVETLCTPGAVKCRDDGLAVELCGEEGMVWGVMDECITGATCEDKRCQCPTGMVAGAEDCATAGVDECAEAMTALEGGGCSVEPMPCGAGQIFAGGECLSVGILDCGEGWKVDEKTSGCAIDELPCTDGKFWSIGLGCIEPGLALDCGNVGVPWPALVPEGHVVYVLEGASKADAEGTKEAPYPDIASAVAAAPVNATVIIGSGDYSGGVYLDKPLTIVGKCAEYVTIDGGGEFQPPGSEFPAYYHFFGAPGTEVELAGFTLTDDGKEAGLRSSGILIDSSASRVHDVSFQGLSGAAVHFHDCSGATASDLVVFEQTNYSGVGPYGPTSYGVFIEGGSDNVVERCRFEKVMGSDVRATATCPTVRDSYFYRRGGLGGLPPMGIRVDGCQDGVVAIEGNYFLEKMTHAILVEGGEGEIRNNTVVGTVSDYDDANGPSIKVTDGKFAIESNYLLDNQFAGINMVNGEGSISGNRVDSGIASDPGLKNGDGIIVKDCDPGPLAVEGNTITNNTRNGLLISSSIVHLEGNVILETRKSPALNVTFAAGINVVDGSDVQILGNIVSGSYRMGIRFDNAYGHIDGNLVNQTEADDDGRCGGGIYVAGDKSSYLQNGITRNMLTDNYCSGIFVENSTVATIAGNLVEKTSGEKGSMGIGILTVDSVCDVQDNWVRDNDDSGLLFQASSGTVSGNVFEGNGLKGAGGGLFVQDVVSPPVEVLRNTFVGNGLAGLIARKSRIEIKRNTFLENVPAKSGIAGAGIWLEDECEGEVRNNAVFGSKLAGMVGLALADVTFSVNYVRDTLTGHVVGGDAPIPMADGIVIGLQSFASVLYNKFITNGESGVLYVQSEGIVSGNTLIGNEGWGIELSNSQLSMSDNRYDGNKAGEVTEISDRTGPEDFLGKRDPCQWD